MKKMIVVLVFLAAIAAVVFFGLRAGEEGVAVASATVTPAHVVLETATPEPVVSATTEPVAVATPIAAPEVNSVADLVQVATGDNEENVEVAVATPTPSSTPVATPVATPAATPEWYEELIEASASKLFATTVATAERGGKTAAFCWGLTQEELAEMPAGSWIELTQFVTNWDEYDLPQNSQGILALLREMDPLAVYKAAAGSKAPVSSVSEEGFLAIWRDAVSIDTAAVKAANHMEHTPVVVALREPDEAGRRYFLVVAGEPAKGYRVEKPVAPAPSGSGSAPSGGSNSAPAPEYNSKPESSAPAPEYNSKPAPGGPAPEYNEKPAAGGSENSSNNGDFSEKPAAGGAFAGGHQTTTDDLSGAGPRR